jgi:hypothetical protein
MIDGPMAFDPNIFLSESRYLLANLNIPDMVGLDHRDRHNNLGQEEQENTETNTQKNKGCQKVTGPYSTAFQGYQLIVSGHQAKNDEYSQQHGHGGYLRNDKKDSEAKENKSSGYGYAGFKKIINFLKKIDNKIYADHGGQRHTEDHNNFSDQVFLDYLHLPCYCFLTTASHHFSTDCAI